MAAELSSRRKRKSGGILTHLSWAACEWFLMFLLFVDAVFTYLLREFAKYRELQTPCQLCSRIDHVLGENKLGCCWNLVCRSHKEEISSLIFCPLHGELTDFRGMCEECFKSIAVQKNSNFKLLLGKLYLWEDVEGSSGIRSCSCCNKKWLPAKSVDETLLELKPVGLGDNRADVPGRRRFSRRDGMKRLRDKLAASVRHRATGKNSVATLSRVEYAEFKLSSDSEPEDGGGDGNMSCIRDNQTKIERGIEFGTKDHLEMPMSSAMSEKQTHRGSERKDQPGLLGFNELETDNPSLSDAMIGHASRESQPKGSLRWTKDVTSLDCVTRPPDVGSLDASTESSDDSSDSIYIVPSASSTVRITKKSIYIEESRERVNISESMDIEEATSGTSSDDDGTCSSTSCSRNLTATLCHSAENMNWTEEDTKHITSNSEVGLLKDADPEPYYELEESTKDEDCSSQSPHLPVSLKRNDSSYESLEGLRVGDVADIDQLRWQIEHDRRSMKLLYEEMEKERNAAEIAVDQAMAMITRLQKEKAEVEMVAVQCMRLMELQAEYDMESLERDLFSEKEKELQDLKVELEFYRKNLCDGSELEDTREETSEAAKFLKANGRCDPMSGSSVSEFGDEKVFVSHGLKKLVKNLYKDYCGENEEDATNGLDIYKIKEDEVGVNLDTMLDYEHNGSCISKGDPVHYYESELDDKTGPDSMESMEKMDCN